MDREKVAFIEELAANAWRSAVEQHIGGWRLRFSGGNSRRVNSVWPNRTPDTPELDTGLQLVEDFYERRGTIPRYQLCPAAEPESLADRLSHQGYIFTAHTSVKTSPIDRLLEAAQPPQVEQFAASELTDVWFRIYTGASGYSERSLPIRRGILTRIGPAARFLLFKQEDQPAAVGLGVAERGWLGVFCVVTVPEFRRQGLAGAVMHALAAWGKGQGAEHVYLQVMDDNLPALALYEQLGFEQLYQYFYAEKP